MFNYCRKSGTTTTAFKMVKLKLSSDFSAVWQQSETREKMPIVQKSQGEKSVLRDPQAPPTLGPGTHQ